MQLEDLEAVHAYVTDPSITMMMYFPLKSVEETRQFLERSTKAWEEEEPEDREFVVLYQGEIIGGVNLERFEDSDDGKTLEIGWLIHNSFRNQGFATEAAEALIRYAFDELGAKKVIARCDSRNQASEKVMQKLGMYLADAEGTRCYPRTGEAAGEYTYAVEKEV